MSASEYFSRGLTVLILALALRHAHFLTYVPEDYRLGVAAGKGGSINLVVFRNMGLASQRHDDDAQRFDQHVVLSMFGLTVDSLMHLLDLGSHELLC